MRDAAFVQALKKRGYLGLDGKTCMSDGLYLYLHELWVDGRESKVRGVSDIDAWRLVVEHWRAQGKDLRHLEVPPELAAQLDVPLSLTKANREIETDESEEDDMASKKSKKPAQKGAKPAPKVAPKRGRPRKETGVEKTAKTAAPASLEPKTASEPEAASESGPKWKKRRAFDGETCGYVDCDRKADGYVSGIRSTKEGEADRKNLWFGPACTSCVRKHHPSLTPMPLAELARQRNGVSDLALVLDLEVGEVHKRLAAAGVNDRGVAIAQEPKQEEPVNAPIQKQAGEEQHTVTVVVPYDVIGAVKGEMEGTLAALSTFSVRSQDQMNYASNYLQRVKGLYNDLDARRKDVGKPFRKQIDAVQAYFKPALEALSQVETQLKAKIQEGLAWSQQTTAQSYQQAQQALTSGDVQGVAIATQQAMGADMALPQGLSTRSKIRFEVIDASQLPGQFWSPDPAKIQAAIDAGYTSIPGVRIWEEQNLAARAVA